jgi:hypothetical protein
VREIEPVEGAVLLLASAMCVYQVAGTAKWFGSNLDLLTFAKSGSLGFALLILFGRSIWHRKRRVGTQNNQRSTAWASFGVLLFISVLVFRAGTPRDLRFVIKRSQFDRLADRLEAECRTRTLTTGASDFELQSFPIADAPIAIEKVVCRGDDIEIVTGVSEGIFEGGEMGFARGGDPKYRSHNSRTPIKLSGGWWLWQEQGWTG